MENAKVIECPRDAWQGLPDLIPTEYKVDYLKELIAAGFRHIDAISFVSPKHVKQTADSEEVMARLNASLPAGWERPEIIGIVVNEKGLQRALATPPSSWCGSWNKKRRCTRCSPLHWVRPTKCSCSIRSGGGAHSTASS